MPPWAIALATVAGGMSPIPRTCVAEGKPSDLHVCTVVHVYPPIPR